MPAKKASPTPKRKMVKRTQPLGVNNKNIVELSVAVADFAKKHGVDPSDVTFGFDSNYYDKRTELRCRTPQTDAELEKERQAAERRRKEAERERKARAKREKEANIRAAVNVISRKATEEVEQKKELIAAMLLIADSDPAVAKRLAAHIEKQKKASK